MMKMFRIPRFVRSIHTKIVRSFSLLYLIWIKRDLKEAEKKVLKQHSMSMYGQRRITQIIALGFSPPVALRLVKEYGVGPASAAALAAMALRYNEPINPKHKRPNRKKMVQKLICPTSGTDDKINKPKRLRSVLLHPYINLDSALRRIVDGITLSRNEHSIGKFYECLVHLMTMPDSEFPPKPDMTGIQHDPNMFDWVDEPEEVPTV